MVSFGKVLTVISALGLPMKALEVDLRKQVRLSSPLRQKFRERVATRETGGAPLTPDEVHICMVDVKFAKAVGSDLGKPVNPACTVSPDGTSHERLPRHAPPGFCENPEIT